MEGRKFGSKYVLRINKGEEVLESLKKFCKDEGIKLGNISGIGAANRVTVGLFEVTTKKYHSKELVGEFELTSLMGNVTTKDGEVYLHIHANVADDNYNTFGGHLNEAWISATCEIIIDAFEGEVERRFDDEVGLNLIKFVD